MNISHAASRGEWLAARLDLSAKEKAASRQLAAVAKQRRALPAVAIDKDNVFEGPDGRVGLIDLFNCDFHVSNDESIAPIEYNYKDKATLVREGLEYVAGFSHLFGLRCGCRCHAEHLPVPGSDPAGPAALHQRMAMARHVWGTGSS